MPLGVGFKQAAGIVDRDVLADAGQDILQGPPFGRVIEHVVDRDERDAVLSAIVASLLSRRLSSPR